MIYIDHGNLYGLPCILFLKLIFKKPQRDTVYYFDLENSKITDYFYGLLSTTRDDEAPVHCARCPCEHKVREKSDTKIIQSY